MTLDRMLQNGLLCCPRHRFPLTRASDTELRCEQGDAFPVVDGIPVLLLDDAKQTIGVAHASLQRAKGVPGAADERAPELYLESLAVSETEKQLAVELLRAGACGVVDPAVAVLVAATNGIAYRHLVGKLDGYPIPDIRLPPGESRLLLDVGCSWGRWCISAAEKGYRPIGLDPSLSAVMAARRVARRRGLDIGYVCGDARYLPFASSAFDTVFSYSVIQHFSKDMAEQAFAEIGRVLRQGGNGLVQMPNRNGVRSFLQWARRGFGEGRDFDVRYWRIGALKTMAEAAIGPTEAQVHCYFGIGLEPADYAMMRPALRAALNLSEALRRASMRCKPLIYAADSVYLRSQRRPDPVLRAA